MPPLKQTPLYSAQNWASPQSQSYSQQANAGLSGLWSGIKNFFTPKPPTTQGQSYTPPNMPAPSFGSTKIGGLTVPTFNQPQQNQFLTSYNPNAAAQQINSGPAGHVDLSGAAKTIAGLPPAPYTGLDGKTVNGPSTQQAGPANLAIYGGLNQSGNQQQQQGFTLPSGMKVDAQGNPLGGNPQQQQQQQNNPLASLGAMFNNPQSQQYLQTQIDTLQRLGALQTQLAQAGVPSSNELDLTQNINQLQNTLNNSTPNQYLKDNPSLQGGGITEAQLERTTQQASLPLTQSLANLVLSKSVLQTNRQNQFNSLQAESTGLTNQASIAGQIRQLTQFGGIPPEIASMVLQRTMFPQYGVTTDALGQPIAYNQYDPSQNFQIGGGGFGAGTQGGGIPSAVSNAGKGLAGYNLSTYATDPQYTQKVGQIYNSLPQFQSAGDITSYIKGIAPNSPLTGDMIMASSTKYGVDPRVLLAQAQEESKFSTLGAAVNTNNPGNVGNTDSGATHKYPTVQAGLDAQAQQLAKRYEGYQQTQAQGLPQLLQTFATQGPNNTNYIDSNKVPAKFENVVKAQAAQYGIPYLMPDEVSKLKNIDVTTKNLNSLSGEIDKILAPGLWGRLGVGLIGNNVQNFLQTNQDISAFKVYRDTAINTIQALAGGQGSGFRLNQSEIDTATSNLPSIDDNIETARAKLTKLQGFLNNWTNELLNQGTPSGSTGASDPLGIL